MILFGIPEHKRTAYGSEAWSDAGVIPQAVAAIKRALPDLLVITDVCLCEYTDHGHCGVVQDGAVQNDPTLELLTKEAVAHARAGADLVAPSDMMDGRVGGDPRRARRRRVPELADHGLRRQVRLGVLRPLPRRGRNRRRSSATGAAIRWTRPTPARRCARSRSTSRRAPTS